jgi:hypothetical protein
LNADTIADCFVAFLVFLKSPFSPFSHPFVWSFSMESKNVAVLEKNTGAVEGVKAWVLVGLQSHIITLTITTMSFW